MGPPHFFDELLEIPVIVLPTVRFVGILAQNLYSNRDVQHYEFRTMKILTYQYLVPLVSLDLRLLIFQNKNGLNF